MAAVDDARRREHAQGVVAAFDVKLVPRRRVEGTAPIRSYLGADPAVAKERKRAAGRGTAPEVEVERPVARPA